MSICVSWSTEHGCTRCRNMRECSDQGLSPFDNATAPEMNALVDAEVLPEFYRREFHAIARVVDFCRTNEGKRRLILELERDDGVWFEIEKGDLVKIFMAEKRHALRIPGSERRPMTNTETPGAPRNTEEQLVRWAVLENVVTLIAFAAIVIFAPGGWKCTGLACLLNINYFKKRETPNTVSHRPSEPEASEGSVG